MGGETVGFGFDQGRALAPAGAIHGVPGRLVAGEHVVAVHHHPREAIAGRAVGNVLDGHLAGLRHRDRVAIVLADEEHRQLVDAREIHGFVAIPLAGATLAEIGSGDGIFLAHL